MKPKYAIPDFCEPAITPDTVITGIAYVNELAPNLFRVALYVENQSHYGEGVTRDVQLKPVMTRDAMAQMVEVLSMIAGPRTVDMDADFPEHLLSASMN